MCARRGLPTLLVAIVLGAMLGCGGGGGGGGGDEPIPPTLASIDPTSGPEAGGVPLTLTGTGFEPPATVTVGGEDATGVVVVSDTTLTCNAPPGTPGPAVDVVVTTAGGPATLPSAFTYLAAPTVTDVTPDHGPAGGGTTITVTGTGFDLGVSRVRLAGQDATSIVVGSDTSLTCVTPSGTGLVAVSVTTPGGSGQLDDAFTYDIEVTLSGCTPATGFTTGGTHMKLTGSGFASGAAGTNTVTVGGVTATSVVAVDDLTLTCTAPAGTTGSKRDVQVTNGNGSATLTACFEYLTWPPGLTTPNKRIDPGTAGTEHSMVQKLYCAGTTVYALWTEGNMNERDVTFSRSTDGGVNWSTPVKLNTNTAGASDSVGGRLCINGQNLYVVFMDDRNNTTLETRRDIYFQRSADGGQTWLATDVRINTSAAGSSEQFDVNIGCEGQKIVVAYARRAPGLSRSEVRVQRSVNGGSTWLSNDVDVRDAAASGGPSTLRMATDGSDVHLLWMDSRNDTVNRDIYATSSTDNGVTWSTTNTRLDTDTAGSAVSQVPRISCDGSLVHAVWSETRNGKTDVYYSRSANRGATWLATDVRLNTNAAGASYSNNPWIASENGCVYVVWVDDRNASGKHDVYFNRSTNGGSTFLASDVRISTDTAGNAAKLVPRIACTHGHAFVTWQDKRNGVPDDIYATWSADAGATWLGSDLRLNDDTAGENYHNRPVVCCDGARAYFAWTDRRAHISIEDIMVVATTP